VICRLRGNLNLSPFAQGLWHMGTRGNNHGGACREAPENEFDLLLRGQVLCGKVRLGDYRMVPEDRGICKWRLMILS
jgi:hypothetical protein